MTRHRLTTLGRSLRAIVVGVLVLAAPATAGSTPPGGWPAWPTAIDEVAAALGPASDATESLRAAAVRSLEPYPDAMVLPYIRSALQDEAPEVQREAMRVCVDRALRDCLDAARGMWMNTDDLALRTRALELFAIFPEDGNIERVVEALTAEAPGMREWAGELLSRANLTPEQDLEVRTILQSKLDDVSAATRASAATALGLRGPGPGLVALLRRLEDPDPAVREAAALALGRFGDPKAGPAILRALANNPTRNFTEAAVAALARLPGEDIDEALLALFDRPPEDRRDPIVDAIGMRANPSDWLIEGLITRLRDRLLRADALRALRWMGPVAYQPLRRAIDGGVEPSLRVELEQLVAPYESTSASTADAGPTADASVDPGAATDGPDQGSPDVDATTIGDWPGARGRGLIARLDGSKWSATSTDAFVRSGSPGLARDELWATRLAPRSWTWRADHRPLVRTRLVGWALDPTASESDRCLAAGALAHPGLAPRRDETHLRRARRVFAADLRRIAGEAPASVRACLAEALLVHGGDETFAMLTARTRSDDALDRVHHMALADRHPGPRSVAAWAIAELNAPRRARDADLPAATLLRVDPLDVRDAAWVEASVVVDGERRRVQLPVWAYGSERWVLLPAGADAEIERQPRAPAAIPRAQF